MTGTVDGYTATELRAAIAHIRSLPTGRRWSWRTLRRERYGPDVVLLSWISHAEDLLDTNDQLRAAPATAPRHTASPTAPGPAYGAKCHRCAHVRHDGEAATEPVPWLRKPPSRLLWCSDCPDCQHDALITALDAAGHHTLAPDVRDAIAAFRHGNGHPILDQLHNTHIGDVTDPSH